MDMDNGTDSNPFDENTSDISAPALEDTNLNPVEDDHSGRNFIWLLLGVAAMVCGLLFAAAFFFFQPDAKSLVGRYFPSPTATPTSTPTQPLTITPSPTPNLTATFAAEEWDIILRDNFTSNKKGWDTEYSEDDRAKSIITVTNGKYNWDIASHKLVITTEKANTSPLGDFVMSADVKQVSGPETAEYGIVFRENSDFYHYYFGINNKGEYFLFLYYDEWITLIDYTQSASIHPYEYNRITVLAEGSHFTFFINDQYVAEFTNGRINKGKVGLFAILTQSDQHAVFEFDNVELRAPK